MVSSTITVFEHSKLYIGEMGFEERHFDALVKYNEAHGGKYFNVGHQNISFKSYVGVIQAGDIIIEILPKADNNGVKGEEAVAKWQSALIYMLEKAGYIKLNETEKASQAIKRKNLLDLYLFTFLKQIEQLIHAGLVKKYRRIRNNGTSLKGRLLIEKQILFNSIHKQRFYTEHTVYDRNNLFNSILKRALEILERISTNSSIKNEASKQLLYFEDIKSCAGRQEEFDILDFGRKTKDYEYPIELARMIILNYNPSMSSGSRPILAILFDMNRLFEKYIYRLLKAEESRFGEYDLFIEEQCIYSFWQHKPIKPDLVISFSKQNDTKTNYKVVVDTKWKVIDANNPSDDDLKQVYAYNFQVGSQKSILLYPFVNQSTKIFGGAYECGLAAPDFQHMCELYFAELFDEETSSMSPGFSVGFLQHILGIVAIHENK